MHVKRFRGVESSTRPGSYGAYDIAFVVLCWQFCFCPVRQRPLVRAGKPHKVRHASCIHTAPIACAIYCGTAVEVNFGMWTRGVAFDQLQVRAGRCFVRRTRGLIMTRGRRETPKAGLRCGILGIALFRWCMYRFDVFICHMQAWACLLPDFRISRAPPPPVKNAKHCPFQIDYVAEPSTTICLTHLCQDRILWTRTLIFPPA